MWKNRIVGFKEEAPDQLLGSPNNWRFHPQNQQALFVKVINDIGIIAPVIANRRSGRIIDGHMRVTLAMRQNIPTIPVLYVDLTEEEEREALATFDSIGAMAGVDGQMLTELLGEITELDLSFSPFVDQILEAEGVKAPEIEEMREKEPKPKEDIECPVCGTMIHR
jgi:hypothetical protein